MIVRSSVRFPTEVEPRAVPLHTKLVTFHQIGYISPTFTWEKVSYFC